MGVEKELAGIKIPKPGGGYYNHVEEMLNTIKHLDKQMISIERTLKNPNLAPEARGLLTDAYTRANQTVLRMSNSLTSDLEVAVKPRGVAR